MFEIKQTSTIKEIIDNSNTSTERRRVMFNNGYKLSIIAGKYACHTPGVSVEVAVIDKKGKFTREFFDKDHNNDILGHQTKDAVKTLITKIGNHL